MEGRGGGKTREVFFTTKSYFLQVKSLILVGTLEKYQFLILMIPKAFLICGQGYGLPMGRSEETQHLAPYHNVTHKLRFCK
ncbi:hypothetical protein B1H38_02475 [Leptospira borgpetersenii serovar Ballum]|nr:hypothetical protein B1H38_02475 [Leptospira borgpetersenii serovar Ballum]